MEKKEVLQNFTRWCTMNDPLQKLKEILGRLRLAGFGGAAGSWGMILGGAVLFFSLLFVFSSSRSDVSKKVSVVVDRPTPQVESTRGLFLGADVDQKAFVDRLERQYHDAREKGEGLEKKVSGLDQKIEHLLDAQQQLSVALAAVTERGTASVAGAGTVAEMGSAYNLDIVNIAPVTPREAEGLTLPAGSFVRGTLLTGVYAPAAQATPLPVLIRLNEAFVGPNERRIPLPGAFVVGKATGELNSERALVQAVSISAYFPDGKVFEHQGNIGYVTDGQGELGLKGTVIRNTGARLAASFMSGFLSGAAEGMSEGEVTSTVNDGHVARNVTGSSGRYAMFQGLSKSAGQLSQYYADQLQAIVPAVKVDPGVEIYLVILEGVKIDGLKDPYGYRACALD